MRLMVLFFAFLFLSTQDVYAQALTPPLTGAMQRLEIFAQPKPVSEVVLKSPTGSEYLSKYRGKIVLLNVWATWCPPCVAEMPSLNALQKAVGTDKLVVVPISLEPDVDKVKKFMDDNQLDMLTPYIDSDSALQRLDVFKGVQGVPVTIFLNQEMQAFARFQGDADWNSSEARVVVDYFIKHVQSDTTPKVPALLKRRSQYY